jgi:hypothetical protein
MTTTNTWYYRFAFLVGEESDIPPEFASVYRQLLEFNGHPAFGLFTPTIEEGAFLISERHPPRLILIFRNSLVVLSLDTHSDQVHTLVMVRADFLGFGLGEFLLNCWLTLYPGNSANGKMQVRFPSRAGQHYWELCRLLLDWCDTSAPTVIPPVHVSSEIPGLPPKFASFLITHPELAIGSQYFFQPAMESGQKRQDSFCNLLLAFALNGIIALGDQYRRGRSELGIEMTYLPLRRVRSAEWIDRDNRTGASLRISLQGRKSHLEVSWPVFAGMKPYALRWNNAVNSVLESLRGEDPIGADLARRENESGDKSSLAARGDDSRVSSTRE